MKTVAIIQVRSESERLPNKCYLRIFGKTVLEHIVNRLKTCQNLDGICVATTDKAADDGVVALAAGYGVACFRGSENDVLDRFFKAAQYCKADIIVRITADDPFKDPKVIDQFVEELKKSGYDYVSNTIKPTYPEGIDTEVFTMNALERAWNDAKLPSEHEHVTPYIWKNPQLFKLMNMEYGRDLSSMRWTLDKPQDWVFVQQVYDYLYPKKHVFLMDDILTLLEDHPYLTSINNDTVRNEGYLKSLRLEKEGANQ